MLAESLFCLSFYSEFVSLTEISGVATCYVSSIPSTSKAFSFPNELPVGSVNGVVALCLFLILKIHKATHLNKKGKF